ncbi:MAG: hypothetical protein DA408_08320 [Bacteroidetes bacterium]|nr:MAG: hypothetical protein C7N36_04625 [Bacteroidota bacterium]PTM13072.1 MAG: hypothetical protein DA408_08320 [Bacteroidota bacterium]
MLFFSTHKAKQRRSREAKRRKRSALARLFNVARREKSESKFINSALEDYNCTKHQCARPR